MSMDSVMDVYTPNGYIIDGKKFRGRDAATRYLVTTGCMEQEEAESFLASLFRAYRKRVQLGANRVLLGIAQQNASA